MRIKAASWWWWMRHRLISPTASTVWIPLSAVKCQTHVWFSQRCISPLRLLLRRVLLNSAADGGEIRMTAVCCNGESLIGEIHSGCVLCERDELNDTIIQTMFPLWWMDFSYCALLAVPELKTEFQSEPLLWCLCLYLAFDFNSEFCCVSVDGNTRRQLYYLDTRRMYHRNTVKFFIFRFDWIFIRLRFDIVLRWYNQKEM